MIFHIDSETMTTAITCETTIDGAKDYFDKYNDIFLDYDTSFYLYNDTLKIKNDDDIVTVTLFCDDFVKDLSETQSELKEHIKFFKSQFNDIFSKIENKFIGRVNGVDVYEKQQ